MYWQHFGDLPSSFSASLNCCGVMQILQTGICTKKNSWEKTNVKICFASPSTEILGNVFAFSLLIDLFGNPIQAGFFKPQFP